MSHIIHFLKCSSNLCDVLLLVILEQIQLRVHTIDHLLLLGKESIQLLCCTLVFLGVGIELLVILFD